MTLEFSRHTSIDKGQKLGRNERCRCGSGKKYKHCCLEKDESDRSDVHKKLVGKVVGWVYEQKFAQDILSQTLDRMFDNRMVEEEALFGIVEAYIYEGVYKNKRIIDHFIEKANLTENERVICRRWRDESVFSFFEVIEAIYGESVRFKNLSDDKEYFVRERSGTYQINPGDILAQRLLPKNDIWMIAGGLGMVMSDKEHSDIFKKEFSKVIGNMPEFLFVEAHYGKK